VRGFGAVEGFLSLISAEFFIRVCIED